MSLMVAMSEGIPGAASVLAGMATQHGAMAAMDVILNLDDMNIRGTQLWIAFKDHCDQDLEKLRELAIARDADMVKTVNEMCIQQGFDEMAVEHGGSWEHGK